MRHVVIFARKPKLGCVKTRLANDIGSVEALRFYRSTLFAVARRLSSGHAWTTWIAVTPDSATRDAYPWPPNTPLLPQGSGDIGVRMARCMARFGPFPVLIVGSDIPELGVRHIAKAFAALRNNDFVFGPSSDGGYWLVGAVQGVRSGGLFEDVRWSTENTLSDTVENVRAGKRNAFIDVLSDVDNGEAYRARGNKD
ncbi:MAG: TIGR04282 family arsenosugar biosynthesis glycosyltransferase [Pseudomonadota bacterium]|nr:TIGR04282 family arsenosugar biosynthesis glycosyltransferase [Pseudomonadota bacterium]